MNKNSRDGDGYLRLMKFFLFLLSFLINNFSQMNHTNNNLLLMGNFLLLTSHLLKLLFICNEINLEFKKKIKSELKYANGIMIIA